MNNNFNAQEYQTKMRRYTDKMLLSFKDITFHPTDDQFQNIILSNGDKQLKISHHSFYGYSRIARKDIDDGERFLKSIEVTDEMFVNNYLKPWVENLLVAYGMNDKK